MVTTKKSASSKSASAAKSAPVKKTVAKATAPAKTPAASKRVVKPPRTTVTKTAPEPEAIEKPKRVRRKSKSLTAQRKERERKAEVKKNRAKKKAETTRQRRAKVAEALQNEKLVDRSTQHNKKLAEKSLADHVPPKRIMPKEGRASATKRISNVRPDNEEDLHKETESQPPPSPEAIVVRPGEPFNIRSTPEKLLTNLERKALALRCKELTPLEFAQSTYLDEGAPMEARRWATDLLMPYMHQKLPTAVNLEANMNVKSGVLVAPAAMTPEEWIAQFAAPKPDDDKDLDAEDIQFNPIS